MNYDEITKITAERISDYMTEAVNTDSIFSTELLTVNGQCGLPGIAVGDIKGG
ncbi:hypothetical protein PU157_003744 [Escherichia coli]|nr:hypothetical protein [Escherichia coli]